MARIKCFLVERDHELKKYRRVETGELFDHHELQPGAMWWAPWYADMGPEWNGPDGRSLIVMTPGGSWMVDSRASNCTKKEDNLHKCWVRHGEAPEITVDKNGNTCAAGAGSILTGGYHGFLRNGYLEDC